MSGFPGGQGLPSPFDPPSGEASRPPLLQPLASPAAVAVANPLTAVGDFESASSSSASGVYTARATKRKWYQYEITTEKVKLIELMNFSRQCSSFVKSGIPILDALELIAEETTDKLLKRILIESADRVRNGASLSDGFVPHGKAFPPYYLPMIKAAELTGELDDVLDQLAEYLSREIEAKRKIKSALTYPMVVVAMAVLTVIVLSGWVLPKFKGFFESLHAKLPLPTRMLLAFTDFITAFYKVGVLGLALIVIAITLWIRTPRGRLTRDRMLLHLPGLGIVLRYTIVERFCRILSSMVQAGVPLPDAMAVAAQSSPNLVYRNALSTAREAMIRGEGLARPIAETNVFPSGANQMLRVGEQTGTLDQQLKAAASFYERELDYRLKRFTDLFEPAIIVAVGFIVGFVAIALVSAMYGVYGQVGG